jgi:glycolate oxidase iron-sulfur subunit
VRFVETERLLSCVHCGLCLSSCPTYLELGTEADSPRGRILLMRALEEGTLEPTPEVVRHLDSCLGCRACETACPSGVPYGSLIEAARPFVERTRSAPVRWARRALATAMTDPFVRRLTTAPMRAVAGRSVVRALARRTRNPWLSYAAALPRDHARTPAIVEARGPARGTAVLITGCVADSLFSGTNLATARLLSHAGVRVVVPPSQGCCGALAQHLGDGDRARAQASALSALLDTTGADWVVTNAAGCGAHVQTYEHLLPQDPAARRTATRARDALALLDEVGLPPPSRPLPRTIAIHDPCHLAHGQGVRDPVRRLLAAIPGVTLVPLAESELCCGSAGTYNLTEPAMAARLLRRKLDHIAASGAELIAAANPGCLLQIRAGAIARGVPIEIAHPIDLLATAHGLT